jgi:site-specific recombinase XerC
MRAAYGKQSRQAELRLRDHEGLYWSELEISREDRESDAREAEALRQKLREELQEEIARRHRTIGERDVVIADLRHAIQASELNPPVEEWLAEEMIRKAFPTITPHDLRHTAASLAVSAHANVKAVQRMLGHAKASMSLDIYADLFDEDLDGVADRLDAAIQATTDALRTAKVP